MTNDSSNAVEDCNDWLPSRPNQSVAFLAVPNELRRMIWSHLSYVYVVHSRMTCWSAHVTIKGDLENILLVPFTMKGLRDFL